MKVQPVIDSAFNNQSFVWGDNPPLRWATNNTKLMRTNTGNYYYAKIEPKSRKTDPFQALVHSMVIENELDAATSTFDDIPVIVC
jgi:phage terminase large subunit-like protein